MSNNQSDQKTLSECSLKELLEELDSRTHSNVVCYSIYVEGDPHALSHRYHHSGDITSRVGLATLSYHGVLNELKTIAIPEDEECDE